MKILLEYWKPLALALMSIAVFAAGWANGAAHVQAKWDKEKSAQQVAAAKEAARQSEATVKIVTEYVDKIKVVRERGATIIKEVPVYVPAQADNDCVINVGFVRLHDGSAARAISLSTGAADAGPSGVALSTVAATIADNYQRCHENAEQLIALQSWTMAMGKIEP
ncbi:MAG: hypothetical protein WCZ86_05910 [Desulfurivibrionaceae bacterium]|jgi:hypothetical protein